MHKIELVIFDCDGVLVDSEYLSNKISAELITKAGYKIDGSTISQNYAGLTFLDILKEIEKIASVPISANLIPQMTQEFRRRMKKELHALPDIKATIEKMVYPFCICSNARYQEIVDMLKLVNLYEPFAGKIFSAPECGTQKTKPQPDIFIYAAQKYQVNPENCIVIEDSVHGVTGARRANMRVIGFTGGSHSYDGHADALTNAGAETVIHQHKTLLPVLKALEEWHPDL